MRGGKSRRVDLSLVDKGTDDGVESYAHVTICRGTCVTGPADRRNPVPSQRTPASQRRPCIQEGTCQNRRGSVTVDGTTQSPTKSRGT